uniref:Chagasin n=2 Tax=Trypanosoma cruzi TaxID=5693 RepID=UPI0000D4FBBB|nr:Chain A, Chagasin [Trypanosoma cruzi]
GSSHKVTKAHNGATLTVAVGELVEIQLPSNPTTGFAWYFEGGTKESPNESMFTVENKYFPPDSKLLGAGGTEHFHVTVKAAGTHAVNLTYMRPWTGPSHDSERFTVYLKAN